MFLIQASLPTAAYSTVVSDGTGVFQLTTTGFQGGRAGPGRKPTRALYTAVASVERAGDTSSRGLGFGSSTVQCLTFPEPFFERTLPLSTKVCCDPAASEILPCPCTSAVILSSAYCTLA